MNKVEGRLFLDCIENHIRIYIKLFFKVFVNVGRLSRPDIGNNIHVQR